MYTRERLGQSNYIDKYGLMLRENKSWQTDDGKPDALFRTSQAYVSYGRQDLLIQMLNYCIVDSGRRLIRHPDHLLNDNSRDQTIMFIYALKFNRQNFWLNRYVKNLKYKLSDKYKMTPVMWLWMKGLSGNCFANLGYQLTELISLVPSLLISWTFRRLSGFHKEYHQDNVPERNIESRLAKIYDSVEYPSYALHLASMMIYSSKRIPVLTWLINKLLIADAEKSNYYIRLLNNDKTAIKDYRQSGYKSMWGVRWSDKLDGRSHNPIIPDYEKRLNTLDVDLMDALIKKETKK